MANFTVSQDFDANNRILQNTNYGITSTQSQTLSGNNTTVSTALFGITGTVEVRALYGIVTTALGSNITAAFWRLNDQTAQVAISLATGTTLSSAGVGAAIIRNSTVAVALKASNLTGVGAVTDPVAATAPGVCMPFILTQKTGGISTNVEFTYTTTNTPTTGVIQHFLRWLPLSLDGNVTVL